MLEAKDIYGWQFTPSYYDVVAQTLSTTSQGEGLAAPIAVPIPSAMVDYNLGKESAPPPLVEGALYGLYYPLDALTNLGMEEGRPNVYKWVVELFQAVAWKDTIEVFIPGLSVPGGKTECLFLPLYWSGRVSDRSAISMLPLLTFNAKQNKKLTRSLDGQTWSLKHPYIFSFASAGDKAKSGRWDEGPGGPQLTWLVFDPKGLNGLFKDQVWHLFSKLKSNVMSFNRMGAQSLPQSPTNQSLKAVEEFGALVSPAIVPIVGWEQVVEYIDTASAQYLEILVSDEASEMFSQFGGTGIEALREDWYGWKSFGDTEVALECMKSSQSLYRRWDDYEVVRADGLTKLKSMNAVYAGFQWWGMAHSEWLNAHSTLVKQQIVIALNNYIEDTNRPARLISSFKNMAFPFRVGDGTKIPKATDFVNEAGNLSPTGRRFYEDYILPVVEAGGTPPTLTVEEAAEARAQAEAALKEASELASPRGAASKAVTQAKNAKDKASDRVNAAMVARDAAAAGLEGYRGEAGEAIAELEKLGEMRERLLEMDVDTDSLDAKIVAAREAVGEEFPAAVVAAQKATDKLEKLRESLSEAKAFLKTVEDDLKEVVEARDEAMKVADKAVNTEKAVIALASYVYVPSSQGYHEFIQDVRRNYDASGAGTGKGAVARAFKWFSGSPQATEAQTGRWSAGSAWQEGFSKARASDAGLGRTEDRLGRFKVGPTRKPPRVVAGPVDVTLMDGTQRKYQTGSPRRVKVNDHIVFDDLAVVFGNEFAPLFDAYKEAYPEREVEEGYTNLVLTVVGKPTTNDEGRWVMDAEPVAFFVEEFTPISDVVGLMDAEEVKSLPLGLTEITMDAGDPFVILPTKWRVQKMGAPKKNPDHRDWSLSRGRLVSPNGTVKAVKRIGKGTFATVYRMVDAQEKLGKVVIEVPDDIYDKEILAEVYRQQEGRKNPHLPRIESLGDTRSGKLYLSEFYKMPLRKGDTKNWKDYQALRACWEEALKNVRGRHNYRAFMYSGHEVLHETVKCSKKHKVKKSIRDALGELRDWAANYGSSYTFEISPRNVGTDAKGNLVLVDVLFDMNKLAKARGKNAVDSRLNGPTADGIDFGFGI